MDRVRSVDGTDIAFERTGQGPPLVLVVGAFCDRSSTRSLAALLGDAFTVYAYDRRGRGASGNTPPYSVEREVEDLAALIEVAGGPAFVFGHSSGAALALEAAASGLPVPGLVVYEPPYTVGPSVEFAEWLERLIAEGRLSDAVCAFLELQGMAPAVIDQMKAAPHWPHMVALAPTLSHEIRLCNQGVVPTDRLARVSAPTLALAGQASPQWAHDGARVIAQGVPRGACRLLEGQSHAVSDDVLAPVLMEFFVSEGFARS